jgi:AcrR family transcriptional regulator
MLPLPKLSQKQLDRRTTILDAAEHCFARSGFHQASMNEICAEAGMSPGNLYRYFPSKEAIIAGIAERSRADAAESFAAVAKAPNFFDGLAQLARHHLVDETNNDVWLCVEIMSESRRNPEVARLHQSIEADVKGMMVEMLKTAAARGEISSAVDFEAAATMLMVIGDGISWRRASDPTFDAERALPLVFQMVRAMLTDPPPESDKESR